MGLCRADAILGGFQGSRIEIVVLGHEIGGALQGDHGETCGNIVHGGS